MCAMDTHIVLVSTPAGPVPTPMPMPFCGELAAELSPNVFVDDASAALQGSKARNQPAHTPAPGPFQNAPSNEGVIQSASQSVFVNDKGAARHGDTATTCNDPCDAPVGSVVAQSDVWIGD